MLDWRRSHTLVDNSFSLEIEPALITFAHVNICKLPQFAILPLLLRNLNNFRIRGQLNGVKEVRAMRQKQLGCIWQDTGFSYLRNCVDGMARSVRIREMVQVKATCGFHQESETEPCLFTKLFAVYNLDWHIQIIFSTLGLNYIYQLNYKHLAVNKSELFSSKNSTVV